MSARTPYLTLNVAQVIQAPIEFDEFLNPNRSALSLADVAGMSTPEIQTMVGTAAVRMPVVISTTIS